MDRRAVGVLSTGHLCIDLCQGAIPAFLPFLLIERHLSYMAAAGLVLAANMASSVVQPIFGHLADRYSTPWLMPAGLVVAGAGLALAGFAPSYLLIALSVALSGIGIAAFHPEAARLMNAVAGKKRATGMSIFSIGGSLGFAIGPLLTTALLLALGLGGASLLLVPEVLLSIVLVKHFSRFALYRSQSGQKGGGDHQPPARPDAWGPFACLTAMIMCRSVIFYGLNTFLPLYWIATLHQSKVAGGTALTVLLASGISGTFVGGRMADRYGRRVVVVLALGCLTPLLLAFVLFSRLNTTLALALLIPIGFALFAPFSVMVVMGQEYLPNRVGTASGVTLGLAVTVGGITAPLFGHIADLYSIHAALGWLACVPLLATVLAFTLPRTRMPEAVASPE
ncbi:MAG: MFS transporter [Ktedonobacteraceae bacterium]|nr:MFS transporter [Ktedonobacteraceae bacterium]